MEKATSTYINPIRRDILRHLVGWHQDDALQMAACMYILYFFEIGFSKPYVKVSCR